MDWYNDEYDRLEREARQEERELAWSEMAMTSIEEARRNDHLIKCDDCRGTGIPTYPLTWGEVTEGKVCEGKAKELFTYVGGSNYPSLFPYCWSCEGKGVLLYSERVALDIEQGQWDDKMRDYDGYF